MTPSTIVVAILLAMIPNEENRLELVAPPAQMPIEECLEQAAQINSDPSTPYIMLCGPLIKGPALDS